jgi:hypothetical protein
VQRVPATVISLSPEELDTHLKTMEEYVEELGEISKQVLALSFGKDAGNESRGPCAGESNELNKVLYDVCISVSHVIKGSVIHLKTIRADIIASQAGT